VEIEKFSVQEPCRLSRNGEVGEFKCENRLSACTIGYNCQIWQAYHILIVADYFTVGPTKKI